MKNSVPFYGLPITHFTEEVITYILKLRILKGFEQHSCRESFPGFDLTLSEGIPEKRTFIFSRAP